MLDDKVTTDKLAKIGPYKISTFLPYDSLTMSFCPSGLLFPNIYFLCFHSKPSLHASFTLLAFHLFAQDGKTPMDYARENGIETEMVSSIFLQR